MLKIVPLSSALLLVMLVGCDSVQGEVEIPEPSAESYSFAFTRDDGGAVVGPVSGSTRYEVTDRDAVAGANVRLATATLVTDGPGRPSATVTVYSTAGTTAYPSPGRYGFSLFEERPLLISVTVGGKRYSPYRGFYVVEEAGPTGLRVRIDTDVTTGGCALLPSTVCSGPTLTGRFQATIRAGADG